MTDLSDWKPARPPQRRVLQGRSVRLEPVDPSKHGADLFAAGRDPEIWRFLPYGPFADEESFTKWLERLPRSEDPLFFAIVDQQSGVAMGVASYLRMEPSMGTIEIGHIWFGSDLQRTRGATEAIYLMAREAFDSLGNRRLEWKCNALNQRSRSAAERFGFTFEGIFRQHYVIKGQNRDSAWYSLLDGEWPAARAAFEAWLADENFDEQGRQRSPLASLR